MFKVPEHQVAGHQALDGALGPLIDDSGRFYKPLQGDERGSNEVAFYKAFYSNNKIPSHIRKFFPIFYGTKLVEASDGSGPRPHLVLEDLTSGRVAPSVIDVKIGSRTWYPEASPDYIEKCVKKDKETPTLKVGFRFSGLQFYRNKELGYWKPKRQSVQCISVEEMKFILKKFVSSNATEELDSVPDCSLASVVYGGSTGILSQLLQLKAWFENQTIYHFFSCSVLMFYEKEHALNGKDPVPEIKLVDFAHVLEGRGVIDHNFLGGLCSLIKFVSDILARTDDSKAPSADKCSVEADECSVEDSSKEASKENGFPPSNGTVNEID